jgi:hypothetical protein
MTDLEKFNSYVKKGYAIQIGRVFYRTFEMRDVGGGSFVFINGDHSTVVQQLNQIEYDGDGAFFAHDGTHIDFFKVTHASNCV